MSSRIIIKDASDALLTFAARLLCSRAKQASEIKGQFSIAVSGGSTPRPMHRLLAKSPFFQEIPWHKSHIFWVDERCVPHTNPASNYGAARKDFIDRAFKAGAKIHPMPVHMDPAKAAACYEKEIREFFKTHSGSIPRLDLIVLGIGTDGHTASLFPGQAVLFEKKRLISAVKGGEPNLQRLTMTYPLLNQAKEVLFLVFGEKKGYILKRIIEEKDAALPASGVEPKSGRLTWLLDRKAARFLRR